MRHLLKEGDLLVYRPVGLFGWIIRLKTWHPIAHVEVYIGQEKSVASRDFIGVDEYPLRLEQLCGIYRPRQSFDLAKALTWFEKEAKGQPYDWLAILGFVSGRHGNDGKMMCSEFATRFYRQGGLQPFNEHEDADKIAPFQLAISNSFEEVWQDWQ